jgi:cellobiose phosphorylase
MSLPILCIWNIHEITRIVRITCCVIPRLHSFYFGLGSGWTHIDVIQDTLIFLGAQLLLGK